MEVFLQIHPYHQTITFSTTDIVNRRVYLVGTSHFDTFGFCAARSDTIEVNISEEAYIVWSALATSGCNASGSGSIVDFRPFILRWGYPILNWADTDNSGAVRTGSTTFEFPWLSHPGVYTFTAPYHIISQRGPTWPQNSYCFRDNGPQLRIVPWSLLDGIL